MAYVKQNWECGEMITADKLNHMEDGIENAGGDCDCGFECEEEWTTLTEETVTTELDGDAAYGDLSYSQLIDAESIKVTFNGTVYECEGVEDDHGYTYGASYDINLDAWDWSEYPFQISSYEAPFGIRSRLVTSTAGTYTVKIEAIELNVTTTLCFRKAVDSLIASMKPMILKADTTETPGEVMLDREWSEIQTAFAQGRNIVVINRAEGMMFENVVSIDQAGSYRVHTVQGNTLRTYTANSTDLHPAYGGK